MRFLMIGASLALTIAACGSDKDACDPATEECGTGTGTGTGTGGGNTNKDSVTDPECLQVATMFMDLEFGYNAGSGTLVPSSINGTNIPSTYRLSWGDANWQGDTSLPGPPDNWCFIEWSIDGATNTNTDPQWYFGLGNVNAANGISNCGQESTPGAGDMVTLCNTDFFGGDPVGEFTAANWSFLFGGAYTSDYQASVDQLAAYGYEQNDFWGGQLAFDFYAAPVDFLSWGLETDGTGAVVLDGNMDPIRWNNSNVGGPGGLQTGFYQTFIGVYFTFNG